MVLAVVSGPGAAAADDCAALGGVPAGGECQIATSVTRSGAFSIGGTLHVLGTGRLAVPPAPASLTLTISGSLILDPPLVAGGGAIAGDAVLPGDAGASVAITAGGDIVLHGDGVNGGIVSANGDQATCGGAGGSVMLTATSGRISVENGAQVSADAVCSAGAITVRALDGDIEVNGRLRSAAAGGSLPANRGGAITVAAAAALRVGLSGRIFSRGGAAGADRVHLESGLDTTILGLVQSLGGPTPDAAPDGCRDASRPGKPAGATACIEVWSGRAVTIDATGLPTGALNADAIASGGVGGTPTGVCCTWIDVFADGDVTVVGAATGTFALSARQFAGNAPAGQVTVKSVHGQVTMHARGIQADGATEAGGGGGAVVIAASSDVALNDTLVRAAGLDFGGSIAVRSFNGAITGGFNHDPAFGALDATPDGVAEIDTQSCVGPGYQGAVLPSRPPLPPACGGNPSLPAFVVLPAFKARPVVTVTGGTFVFDGHPHPATGSVTDAGGNPIGTLTFTYAASDGTLLPGPPSAVGSYVATGSFAGNATYRAASASAALNIVPDTAPTPTITLNTPFVFTYDGLPHAATGAVLGIGGVPIGVPVFAYTTAGGDPVSAPVDAGVYTVSATYAGDAVYKPVTVPVTAALTINRATPHLDISGAGTFTYDGNAHTVTAIARGVRNETLSPAPSVTYSGPPQPSPPPQVPQFTVGTYVVTAAFAGNANYLPVTDAGARVILTQATPTVIVNSATVAFDGAPHGVTADVIGVGVVPEIVTSPPVTLTYAGSTEKPSAAGVYAVVATFPGNTNYTASTGTGTLEITGGGAPPPTEACVRLDFREITYFRDNRVLMSSDAGIRARNGIPGGFNPAVWPYDPRGRGDSTQSRGTLFRVYGFAAEQLGVPIPDADRPGVSYPVQADPEIPGARFVDLGGPARVVVCVSELQHDLIDESSPSKPGVLPGSRVLSDAARNVPGIMLNHNAAVIDVPRAVQDDLKRLGTPLVDSRGRAADKGLVHYVGVQLWGHGAGRYREFVDVEVDFVFDDPADLRAHYTFGFLTAKNVDYESFSGCNYQDSSPGNDAVRFNDVWERKHAGDRDWGRACGSREPKQNQRVRENYDVPFGAIQLLPSVNSGDDTVRLFFGQIQSAPR